MTDNRQFDRIYHYIMETFVERGFGPHYIEIARKFEMPAEEGRKLLHELIGLNMAMWLAPGTDLIASFAPFNNQPTQYRITVGGRQKWFGQ
jgi:hypothetical protein